MKSNDASMEKYLCYRDDQFTLFYRNMHLGLYVYYSNNYMLHSNLRRKNMPRTIKINIKALAQLVLQ